jgi:hypothetical protein
MEQIQRETVATGCHRLLWSQHGKEGVDGSSPSEGSAKSPLTRRFRFRLTCSPPSVPVGMEPLPVVRRIVNGRSIVGQVCRVTSLLVMLERSGSVRAGAQPYLGARTASPATR